MRGLNSSGGNSPTVGFYLDDTPLTTFAFATAGKVVIDPSLYDLSRVEVLRGPQGTLYGASSMGGTVKLVSNQPVLNQFHASASADGSATKGGALNGSLSAMINLPIAKDVAALRIVATEKYLDGWIDRIVPTSFPVATDPTGVGFGTQRGKVDSSAARQRVANVNDYHLIGLRVSLLLQPTEAFRITPMVMYQKVKAGGQTLVDQTQTSTTLTNANSATYRTLGATYQPVDTPEPIRDEFKLASVTAKYDFTGAQLVSASSLWERKLSQVQDGTEVIDYVFGLPSSSTLKGGLGTSPWIEAVSARQFSQELRLASKGASPFQWQVGGYYAHLHSIQHQFAKYTDPAAVANFALIDPLAVSTDGIATTLDQTVDTTSRQLALFGEASYEITPALKFTAGLRYFDFKSTTNASEYGLFAPTGDLVPHGHVTTEHDHGFNPKFNLTWRPTSDVTLYGTIAKGFRPGGTNQIIPTLGVAQGGTPEGDACKASLSSLGRKDNPTTYGPDSVWSYEGGEKVRLFDGKVTINGAVYYEKWRNIQRSITLGCAYIYSDNAGDAKAYGGEAEVAVKLSDALRISVNAGYTHATYTRINTLPALTGSGQVSTTGVQVGQKLPDVPAFTSTQSLAYALPLSAGLTFTAQINNSYIGSREETTSAFTNGSGNSNIPVYLDAYDTASVRLGLESQSGWSASLFVDNLTNNQKALSAINSQVLNITPMRRVSIDRPRTYGINFTYAY